MTVSIEKLIRSNYLKSALAPILVIEVMLIVLYFAINSYVTQQFSDLVSKESKDNLQQIINGQANNVNLQLEEISRSLTWIRAEQEALLTGDDSPQLAEFAFTDGGAWVKQKDNGGSAVIVSSYQPLTDDIKQKVLETERFDRLFKTVTQHNDRVVATYFTSRYHMTRYYPWFEGIETVLPENYDINNYNFYYEANEKNNPEKGVVWTGAYLDPAGKGWMISGLIPVYNKGQFEGSTGIDVTIASLADKILAIDLPYQSSAFILDANGTVLAMPQSVENVLGMKELRGHKYDESIESDVLKPEEFNLLKHKNLDIRSAAKAVVEGSARQSYFKHLDQGYYLYKSPVSLTGWSLIVLVPEHAINGSIRDLESISQNIGYMAIVGMLLFYLVFFLYLVRNAHRTAANLASPVALLAKTSSELGKKADIAKIPLMGIDELDQLATNFNKMSMELSTRTEELIQSELVRREKERQADTDYLTGLSNRRYFERQSKDLWQSNSRYTHTNSIMVIDIDYFKRVNDQFGHEVGDQVLTRCARVIKDVVGDKGIAARIGGEEFGVYIPLKYEESLELAQNICCAVEDIKFPHIKRSITVSIGLQHSDSLEFEQCLQHADLALYKAKEQGRNRVVAHSSNSEAEAALV